MKNIDILIYHRNTRLNKKIHSFHILHPKKSIDQKSSQI